MVDLGNVITDHFEGSFLNLLKKAKYSAVEIVRLLCALIEGFRDEGIYLGKQVFFYKRA